MGPKISPISFHNFAYAERNRGQIGLDRPLISQGRIFPLHVSD